MNHLFLEWLATPGASALAGVISLVVLVSRGCHRDKSKRISRLHISSAFMLAAIMYTLLIILVGFFILHIPLGKTIEEGFGEDRLAWLFAFMCIDVGVRLARIFDGEFLVLLEEDLG